MCRMRKNTMAVLLCTSMLLMTLSGCSEKEQEIVPEIISIEKDNNANEAYMAFLNGEKSIVTSSKFGEDDADGNYDGIISGEYTYADLKTAVEELEYSPATEKYVFLDFGNDGTEELVVKFESIDPSFMNWTGIIHYQDDELELVYSYEDGYRTESTLFESGKLKIGGSWGAGASGMDYVDFNERGEASILFSSNTFFSSFATQIAYDLNPVGSGMENEGYYLEAFTDKSEFEISEYIPSQRDGTGVKISVSKYSSDTDMKTYEEELVGELVSMGAAEISNDEMNKLCIVSGFDGPEAQWIPLEK